MWTSTRAASRALALLLSIAACSAVAWAIDFSTSTDLSVPSGVDGGSSSVLESDITIPGVLPPGVDTLSNGIWRTVEPDGGSAVAVWYIQAKNDSTPDLHTFKVRVITGVPDTITTFALREFQHLQPADSTSSELVTEVQVFNPDPDNVMTYYKAISAK